MAIFIVFQKPLVSYTLRILIIIVNIFNIYNLDFLALKFSLNIVSHYSSTTQAPFLKVATFTLRTSSTELLLPLLTLRLVELMSNFLGPT